MRIATRCTSLDEFIVGFHAFCDDTTCFIPTLGMRPVGLETAFSIQLADGTPMLRGLCVILDAWDSAENPYKRPGLRVGLRRLTPESTAILEQLKAARQAVIVKPVPASARPKHDTDQAFDEGNTIVEPPTGMPPPAVPKRASTAALPVLKIPPIGSPPPDNSLLATGTTPPATISVAAVAAAASHVPDEFETPTLETKLPVEQRTPGSSYILPANPLTSLTDDSIGAFIDCVLYEDMDTPIPADFPTESTTIPPPMHDAVSPPLLPIVMPSLGSMMGTPTPGSRPPIATTLGVAPLARPVAPPVIYQAPSVEPPHVEQPHVEQPHVEPPRRAEQRMPTEIIVRDPGAGNRRGIQLSIVVGIVIAAVVVFLLVWLVALRGTNTTAQVEQPAKTSEVAPPPSVAKPVTPTSPATPPNPNEAAARTAPTTPTPPTPPRPREDPEMPSVGSGPCRIIVNSDPVGAAVAVDGDAMGPTPLAVDGPCRTRKVELTHPRYAKVDKTVTPTEKSSTSQIDVMLQRPTHQLKILSSPLGSFVSVNGHRAGTTPTIIDVMGFSSLNITVEHIGYKPQSKRIYTNLPLSALSFTLVK